MKKNNTAEKAALDAEKITKALQESTEKSMRDIINEAISRVVNESEDDEALDPKDNGYEVEDVEPDETPEVSDVETGEDAGGEEGAEEPAAEDGEEFGGDDTDEWSDMEKYKIGDDDYDFTGVDGDEILKVYNKLGDDDQIFVQKEDDGTYTVKDDETGAEFVIELSPEVTDAEGGAEEEPVDLGSEEGEPAPEEEPDFDFGGEGELPSDEGDEIELELNDEDEDELNEENLGYTDSYQKDVFDKKFNMSEPADKKTTYSMDAGAPDGANKPWAGKGDPKPFGEKADTVDENVDECGTGCVPAEQDANLEENGGTISSTDARHMKKGQIAQHRPNAPAYDVRKVDSPLNEAAVKKLLAKAKALQAENKVYKEKLDAIIAENKQYEANLNKMKKAVYDSAVLTINEARIIDILVNETTTKDEKRNILTRFNSVKTINEGKSLHAAIKAELKEAKKSTAPIVEKQFVAGSAQSLNETTIYSNTENPAMDLMNRMDNLYK